MDEYIEKRNGKKNCKKIKLLELQKLCLRFSVNFFIRDRFCWRVWVTLYTKLIWFLLNEIGYSRVDQIYLASLPMKNGLSILKYFFLRLLVWGWSEKFIWWCHICFWWLFWLMGSKPCNTDGRSVWITRGAVSKNRYHLVTFHEGILVSLWTLSQP